MPVIFGLLSLYTLGVAKHNDHWLGMTMHRSKSSPMLRRDTQDSVEDNSVHDGRIYVNVDFGIPQKSIDLAVETKLSDIYLSANPYSNQTYNYRESDTFKWTDYGFDDDNFAGFMGSERLRVNGKDFNNMINLVTSYAVEPTLGLGPRANEMMADNVRKDGTVWPTYPNFSENLKNSGIIERNAYSVWLAGVDTNKKSLFFGAIDHSKYEGELAVMRMVDAHSVTYNTDARSISVLIDDVEGEATTNKRSFQACMSQPALLDIGNAISLLPNSVIKMIYKAFGATKDPYNDRSVIKCSAEGQISFNFSGKPISIDVKDLMQQNGDNPVCAFAIAEGAPGQYRLGSQLLKSLYFAVDLDNHEVAIANKNSEPAVSDIEDLRAGSGIPRGKKVPNYDHVTFQLY